MTLVFRCDSQTFCFHMEAEYQTVGPTLNEGGQLLRFFTVASAKCPFLSRGVVADVSTY